MAKQEVTGVQVQMAAAAGVKLLQQDDLMVPLSVSKSGALGILEGMLTALANGEVVLSQPPPPPSPEVAAAVGKALDPAANAPPAENIGADGAEPPSAPVESEGAE